MLNVLDLFSGIGGFSLGLERTGGFQTVAFCEIEPYCRAVLRKHWPDVRQYEDVRELTAERLRADGIAVDVICGGFPCQDISFAGKGAGIEGERSGLWSDYARLVGELRPRYVIVENVAALLGRGLDRVLGDLAALGYDAEWHCIPASAVGAPHRRDRLWIVANAGNDLHAPELVGGRPFGEAGSSEGGDAGEGQAPHWQWLWAELGASRPALAYAAGERRREARPVRQRSAERLACGCEVLADTDGGDVEGEWPARLEIVGARHGERQPQSGRYGAGEQWAVEPDVGRVAHGVPSRVDRLRALGNAVVPQIPELIGKAILASVALEHEVAA